MSGNNADSASTGGGKWGYILLIYFLVVLYALCYWIQSPIEPFLVDRLIKNAGAGDGKDSAASESEAMAAYGRIKSFFSLVQCIGSLVFGYILDLLGVRIGLVINFMACALSYYILSITDSIPMLYLSKVPGVAVAGFLCAQTAIIKLTDEGEERLCALGYLTSAYTIGGILGPYLGGVLGSKGDYFFGAKLAVAGCILAAGLVALLPSDLGKRKAPAKKKDEEETSSGKQESISWVQRAKEVVALVWLYLFVKVVTSVANSMASASQPLILKNELKVDEAQMGLVMSLQFGFGGFSNMFLLAPLSKALGGDVSLVVRNSVIVMGVFYLLEAVIFSPFVQLVAEGDGLKPFIFLGIAMILSTFQYALGTSITAETTGIVPKHSQGTLMGIEHSLFSVARTIGPTVGVAILQGYGISGVAFACGMVFMLVSVTWIVFRPFVRVAKAETEDGVKLKTK